MHLHSLKYALHKPHTAIPATGRRDWDNCRSRSSGQKVHETQPQPVKAGFGGSRHASYAG
jgi:hypothetical protein